MENILKVYFKNDDIVGLEIRIGDDILYKNMLSLDYSSVELVLTYDLEVIRYLILDEFRVDNLLCENVLIYLYNKIEKNNKGKLDV